MKVRPDIEIERAKVLKVARNSIRLKHALAADEEIAKVLPDVEAEFDRRVAAGEPFHVELDPVLK